MKKTTRILSAFLAALMLAGSLASCANGSDNEDTNDITTSANEGETALADNLPELNYNNGEITIICRDMEGWTRGEIWVDSLTSEPVNDAVFERNRAVEERLNIQINCILDKDAYSYTVPDKVSTAVKAGTSEYDLMGAAAYATANHSLSGIFVNLRSTEYLDFEQPWWTQGFNEAMTYNDMQFMATGSMLLSIYRFAFVTVFNKALFKDANQPNLYDTVEDGQWTLDKQASLVPLFHRDNGNDTEADGDIYGLISNDVISVDPYWSSCEVDILGKDGDGALTLTFDSAKLFDVAEKVLNLYYNTDGGVYVIPYAANDSEQDTIRNMFAEGYSAMATLRILELENTAMRNMEQAYGVVPMPKFDENQKEYHTLLHDQFTVVAIPTTVKGERLDMVSAFMEAMGSTSYKIVKPVYYEETLRTKIAQDPQSALMMDLVTEGIYIDAGIIYTNAIDSFHSGFRSLVQAKNNDAVSRYQKITKSAEKKLTALVQKLDKIASEQPN